MKEERRLPVSAQGACGKIQRRGSESVKGVVFTTNNKMYVKDFEEPLYQSVGKVVDGGVEIVHPKGLKAPYCFAVNEEGLLNRLRINVLGSVWYQTHVHGCPIVGNIVVLKDGFTDGEPDIVGLSEEEILEIKAIANDISDGTIEEVHM